MSIKSKAWDWEKNKDKFWFEVSDEFLPVALKWKEKGYKTALDIGCGPGRHSIFLSKLGFNVKALDLSEYAIKTLESTAKELNLNIETEKSYF